MISLFNGPHADALKGVRNLHPKPHHNAKLILDFYVIQWPDFGMPQLCLEIVAIILNLK